MIKSISISNVMSIDYFSISDVKPISVFCGTNNSGKTTGLKCIGLIGGENLGLVPNLSGTHGEIELIVDHEHFTKIGLRGRMLRMKCLLDSPNSSQISLQTLNGDGLGNIRLASVEDQTFLFTSFARTRSGIISNSIGLSQSREMHTNAGNLTAKLDRIISDPHFPNHQRLRQLVKDILGFDISCVLQDGGKLPGITIGQGQSITIDRMGEGVSHILNLLVNLVNADRQVFLLEEIETDLHPRALKTLCSLIIEKSNSNQFFISTHSNILVRELIKSDSTDLFWFRPQDNSQIPHTTVTQVKTIEDRVTLLEDLGYDCYDIGLYKLWIVFEESSTERLFREYIIPWQFPDIANRIRTISSRGVDNTPLTFEAINTIFTVFQVGKVFKNRVVVAIDGGRNEEKIISKLKSTYEQSGWRPSQFVNFSFHDLEETYPEAIGVDIDALKHSRKASKAELKKGYFEQLIEWIEGDTERARDYFLSRLELDLKLIRQAIHET